MAADAVDYYGVVRRIALALPGVEEGTSYGTPALKVKGKLLARLWEDGETLVLRVNLFERPYLVEAEPEIFFITDHYHDWPAVLLRLQKVTEARLREAVLDSWRFVAPPKVVAAYDAASTSP
jgi:hypothetical protein